VINVVTSAFEGTLPEITSFSSITSAGVARMGYSMIFLMSLMCSIIASTDSSFTASRVVFSS